MIADLTPAPLRVGAAAALRSVRMEDAMLLDGDTEDRLPWPVAVRVIGGLSIGLWLGIWQLARLIF